MVKLVIQNFGGEVPRQADTMLNDNDASLAQNVKLYSGELRTWNGPTQTKVSATPNTESIYEFVNPATGDVAWLTWATDVNVVRGSLADTTDFRIYYTGDGVPKKSNWEMATGGLDPLPAAWLNMGVPNPTGAPTCSAGSGGSALTPEARYYVYTFVSTFDDITEESGPSPPSAVVNVAASQKVTINGFDTPPSTNYNITAINIYRTVPGENSTGAFVFVAQITLPTSSYVDDLLSTALAEPLSTATWVPPPAGLEGIVSMANGMLAGFVGNSVYFCEPYFHHAWPVQYIQSIPEQIVGLGAYGNTLIVMTQGSPYAMVGVTPDQVSVEKITMPEPCISKRSITADQYGVMYASPNGIVALGPSVSQLVTNTLFRRAEWQDFAPTTMVAQIYDGKYFASFQSVTQGSRTMVLSRDDIPALAFLDVRADAFYTDLQLGALYYLDGNTNIIQKLDDDEVHPLFYEWQSKRFVFPKAITWSVMKMDVDTQAIQQNANYNALVAAILAANQAITGDIHGSLNWTPVDDGVINGSLLQDVPLPSASQSATLVIYDENLVLQCALTVTNWDPQRIPSFKSRSFYIQLTGNTTIRSIAIATSFPELRDDNYPQTFLEARGKLIADGSTS